MYVGSSKCDRYECSELDKASCDALLHIHCSGYNDCIH